jgi:hypothetical protein
MALSHARESPVTSMAVVVGVVLFARVVALQLMSLSLPLIAFEGHHWRQAFTYGVAWNYAHTTLDVLRPRMFVELARSNVVPMEAPLYPLVSSLLLRLGGDSVVGPRLLSWLGLVVTLRVSWGWLADPKSAAGGLADRAGLLVALGLTPMIAVEHRALQPEPVAAGLAVAAAFFFARHRDTAARSDAVKGAALFGLSLLAKPLALGVAPALVLFAAWGDRTFVRRCAFAAGLLLIAALPWLAWDRWAHHMLATELGGQWIIEIEHPAKAMFRTLMAGKHSAEALIHELPNYASSWWLAPTIAAGLYRSLAERRRRRYSVPWLVWIVGYMIELLAVGERLPSNAYYFILAAPPLAYFSALGLGALVRLLDAGGSSVSTTIFRAALASLVLLPTGSAFSRPSTWSNTVDVAALGFFRNGGVWGSELGLGRLLLVFVVVLALAPCVRPKRTPRGLGVAVFVVIAALTARPAGDASQYFRFYVAEHHRPGFDEELRALRSAVDRHSTRSDRIIVSPGGTYREPPMVYFYYALRNGFPLREGLSPRDIDDMRRRGARLYLQIDHVERTTHLAIPGRVLASGSWWRLSCVASDDCPDVL